MRTILHIDMNNFYASVECLYRPEIRDFPVAVAGDPLNRHGIILAKNMLAKKLSLLLTAPPLLLVTSISFLPLLFSMELCEPL